MPRDPTEYDYSLPHPHTAYELVAQALLEGKTQTDAWLSAGYTPTNLKAAAVACCRALSRRSNGLQARLDYLLDEKAHRTIEQEAVFEKKRLQTTDRLQDGVYARRDELYAYATTLRIKFNPQGNPVKHKSLITPSNPKGYVKEMVNPVLAEKILAWDGVDAGLQVRQSKSGRMEEEYGDLDDKALAQVFMAKLEEFGPAMTGVFKSKLEEMGFTVTKKLEAVPDAEEQSDAG